MMMAGEELNPPTFHLSHRRAFINFFDYYHFSFLTLSENFFFRKYFSHLFPTYSSAARGALRACGLTFSDIINTGAPQARSHPLTSSSDVIIHTRSRHRQRVNFGNWPTSPPLDRLISSCLFKYLERKKIWFTKSCHVLINTLWKTAACGWWTQKKNDDPSFGIHGSLSIGLE